MKKILLSICIFAVLLTSLLVPATAAAAINVTVDGSTVTFPDAKPFVDENNRTLIPVRFVSEALGAKVDWNEGIQQAQISKGSVNIKININDKNILINGVSKAMDTQAIKEYDRTFVPIRYVAEALGAKVDWNEAANTVIITTGGVDTETKVVKGYTIPLNSVATIEEADSETRSEVYISLSYTNPNEKPIATQLEEARQVLASKWGDARAKQVIDYVSQKKDRFSGFENKEFIFEGQKVFVSGKPWSFSARIIVCEKGV